MIVQNTDKQDINKLDNLYRTLYAGNYEGFVISNRDGVESKRALLFITEVPEDVLEYNIGSITSYSSAGIIGVLPAVGTYDWYVYSDTGVLVTSSATEGTLPDGDYELDLTALPSGIYTVMFVDSTKNVATREVTIA